MIINGVQIDETFAEAFNMRGTRVIITAQNLKWAYHAAQCNDRLCNLGHRLRCRSWYRT